MEVTAGCDVIVAMTLVCVGVDGELLSLSLASSSTTYTDAVWPELDNADATTPAQMPHNHCDEHMVPMSLVHNAGAHQHIVLL